MSRAAAFRTQSAIAWTFPVLIIACYAGLALTPDLRLTALLPAVALLQVALLAVLLYEGERGGVPWGATTVLVVAALVRLLFVPRPPELSDDLYRYLWDGLQTLAGRNPYALSPAVAPAPGLEWLRARVNHPELVTIYPPAAQFVFAAGASLGGGVLGMKALLALLDLGSCALLLAILAKLGLPAWPAALYAWHPLAVLEVAGSGHVDGAGVFFLLACLVLLTRRNSTRLPWPAFAAGGAFALSVLTKLFPLVFVPALPVLAGWRRAPALAVGALMAAAAVTLPFLPDLPRGLGTLETYARTWEFSGFAFQMLRGLTGSGLVARGLLAAGFCAVCVVCWLPRERPSTSVLSAFAAAYGTALGFLFLTPTLHPWYALYLAALLPFAAGPAGLVLSAAVFLSYRVLVPYALLGQWVESFPLTAGIFAAGAAAGLLGLLARPRA